MTGEAHVLQSVPPAVQRKLREPSCLVFRAGEKPRPGQDLNLRVTKHVSVMAERLRSTLSLTGSFLMLAASEL